MVKIKISGRCSDSKHFHLIRILKVENPCSECGHPVVKGIFGQIYIPLSKEIPDEILIKVEALDGDVENQMVFVRAGKDQRKEEIVCLKGKRNMGGLKKVNR